MGGDLSTGASPLMGNVHVGSRPRRGSQAKWPRARGNAAILIAASIGSTTGMSGSSNVRNAIADTAFSAVENGGNL